MFPLWKQAVAVLPALVLTIGPVSPVSPDTAPGVLPGRYRAVQLGSLAPGSLTRALALNDRGQVVGLSTTASGLTHAFRWQRGRMTDLGVLERGPAERAIANDINERGEVVGGSVAGGAMRAVLWRHGRIIDLGGLGGGYSFAVAINDRGQVVGNSETASGELHAFSWENGRMTDLGIAGSTSATAVDASGWVVGWSDFGVPGTYHAYRWRHGVVTRLPSPETGSQARAVNNRGEVVGVVIRQNGATRAVRWRRGVVTDLGTLPGGTAASAVAVNDRGEILGSGNLAEGSLEEHPFLWRDGVLRDLTRAGVAAEAAYNLSDLNNRGQFVSGAVLFTPAR